MLLGRTVVVNDFEKSPILPRLISELLDGWVIGGMMIQFDLAL